MKNDSNYPDINGLLGDLGNLVSDNSTPAVPVDTPVDTPGQVQSDMGDDDWELFRKNLSLYNFREKKDDRMICKLDRDLADSLDDCDFDRKCRSDIVNAIVRTFVNRYLPRLRQYKRNNRSLLDSTPT
ncbi:hypothetical protein [uncultured Duncaniella sp.]|uniref:hypothetical protein n=1 Tax=uncultured Duncaniella sp. TaxID=2768039 RepID=UPI0025A95F97|nr:hypothetical protein [uncultured Duncaniella sp.]